MQPDFLTNTVRFTSNSTDMTLATHCPLSNKFTSFVITVSSEESLSHSVSQIVNDVLWLHSVCRLGRKAFQGT